MLYFRMKRNSFRASTLQLNQNSGQMAGNYSPVYPPFLLWVRRLVDPCCLLVQGQDLENSGACPGCRWCQISQGNTKSPFEHSPGNCGIGKVPWFPNHPTDIHYLSGNSIVELTIGR